MSGGDPSNDLAPSVAADQPRHMTLLHARSVGLLLSTGENYLAITSEFEQEVRALLGELDGSLNSAMWVNSGLDEAIKRNDNRGLLTASYLASWFARGKFPNIPAESSHLPSSELLEDQPKPWEYIDARCRQEVAAALRQKNSTSMPLSSSKARQQTDIETGKYL